VFAKNSWTWSGSFIVQSLSRWGVEVKVCCRARHANWESSQEEETKWQFANQQTQRTIFFDDVWERAAPIFSPTKMYGAQPEARMKTRFKLIWAPDARAESGR